MLILWHSRPRLCIVTRLVGRTAARVCIRARLQSCHYSLSPSSRTRVHFFAHTSAKNRAEGPASPDKRTRLTDHARRGLLPKDPENYERAAM